MTLSILVTFIHLSSLRLPQRLTLLTISSPPTTFWDLFPLISLKVPTLCSLSFTLPDNSFLHGLLLVPPSPLVQTRRCFPGLHLQFSSCSPYSLPFGPLTLPAPSLCVGGSPANHPDPYLWCNKLVPIIQPSLLPRAY